MPRLFTPPDSNLRFLDGMRALAVLAVIGFHSLIQMPTVAFEVRGDLLGRALLRGGMGVDLFFVLSGYLIGGQLLRQGLGTGRIRFGAFYVKRLFRIFPAYYLVLAVICGWVVWQPFYGAILRGVSPDEVIGGAWSNVLYLNNYTGSRVMPWSWSLAVEEHFYLVVPLLISLVLLRLPHAGRVALLWGLFFLPWVTRYLAWQGLGIEPIPTGVTPGENADRAGDALAWMDAVAAPSHNRFDAIAAGLLCAYSEQASSRARRRWSGKLGLALTGLCLLVLWVYVGGEGGQPIGPGASAILFGPVALAFGGLLQHCLYRERSPLRIVLSWRGFYPVARVSYGMYLLHPVLVAWLGSIGAHEALSPLRHPAAILLAALALNTAVAYASALLMFTAWEWPFMKLRQRMLARMSRT